MLKADRDQLMSTMTSQARDEFRRIIQEVRSEVKSKAKGQTTNQAALEARWDHYPPDVQARLKAVMARDLSGPKEGESPPDFSLRLSGSQERVTLSSFRGKLPVGLIFGSYT